MIVTIKQCQFQHLRDIKITGQNIGFISKCTCFHASTGSTLSGIFNGLSGIQKFLHNRICIIKSRLSPSLSGNLTCFFQKILRCLATDQYIGAWLKKFHFIHTFQYQITYFIDAVPSIRCDSTCIDICKICIGAAFFQRDSDFWRCRLIVKFYPQTFQKFFCFVIVQNSIVYVFSIKSYQMLIKSSRTVGIPRIQFACHSQMYKPVHLNCLPVSLRFVSRHNTAVFCNLKKFCLSFFFCACSCKFFGILCIVLCKNHDRITGNIHAFQFSFFIKGFRIIHIIQFFKGKLDICLMPQKAFIIDVF